MSVEVRDIRESEREECLALWRRVWPRASTELWIEDCFFGDVEWLPYYTQVAVTDGRIVSAVHICKRSVACGEFRLTMGGVANVATLPEYRGRGFNTLCLESAIRVMEADAMDFSLLFTGIPDYYARRGYTALTRQAYRGRLRAEAAPEPTGLRVRSATADDLPAIQAIYDAYNHSRPIAVQRTAAYWRDWLRIAPGRIPETLLAATDAQGRVCGYARYEPGQPPSVTELGARDDCEEGATAALLAEIARRVRAGGAEELRLHLPAEPAVLRAANALLEDACAETRGGAMTRLLHRDNLLRSFTLVLNERWIAAGRPKGVLAFETPYGNTRLNAESVFLEVEPAEDAAPTLPQPALFGLLFGSLSAEEATEERRLRPLLSALFPPQAAVFWDADGF